MQDAITSINSSDVQGKYLDTSAMEKLKATQTGELGTGCYYNQLQRGCDRQRSSSEPVVLTSLVRAATCTLLAAMLPVFAI